jgi:hypothetical protein
MEQRQLTNTYKSYETISKNSCTTKPGTERQLMLAVGIEPATLGSSKELYATTERTVVKVSIYTHRTKAARQTL